MKKLFTLFALMACFMGAKAQNPVYSIDYSDYSSFPFYVMGFTPEFDGTVMHDQGADGWHQYFIADQIGTQLNGNYTVKAMVKASEAVSFNVNMGWGWDTGQQAGVSVNIGTEWSEVTWKYEDIGGTSCNLVAQPWKGNVTVDWKWLKVYYTGQAKDPVWTDIINGDTRCYISKEYPSVNTLPSKMEDGACVVNSPVQVADPWDSQFWIRLPQTLEAGTKFKVSFERKASVATSVGTQCHAEPGAYIHWACIGDVSFTTGWETFEKTVAVPGECEGKGFRSIAFNLSQNAAVDYYFRNIKIEIDEDAVSSTPDYPAPIYTVAGTANLCGTEWNTRDNVMTFNSESGLYTWEVKDVTISSTQNAEFKIVQDCNWDYAWPENNWVINTDVAGGEGVFGIAITFNAETKEIGVACVNKDYLQALINKAQELEAKSLVEDIAEAQAAVDNANITVAELADATAKFEARLKKYCIAALGEVIPVSEMINEGSLDEALATAKAVVANENATAEELVVALKNLSDKALPLGKNMLQEGMAYMATFDAAAANALNGTCQAIEAAINDKDYKKLREGILALIAQGKPFMNNAISKVEGYAKDIENETLDTDLAAIRAAFAAEKYTQLLIALKQYEKDFRGVASAYLAEVKAMDLEGREGADAVTECATILEGKLGSQAPLMEVALAVRNLVLAVRALGDPACPYYLVGNMTNWAQDGVKEEYNLTLNKEAEGEEYMITLDLEAEAEFKIVKNGEQLTWYPDPGDNYVVSEAGNYTVYFRPNGDGAQDWYYGVIYVVKNTATGINAVNTIAENVVVYNLKGQRVVKAQKGLYIVNGKKVILK